jgi:hypothetical protein
MSLRSKVIHLAHEAPELRGLLLPLLKTAEAFPTEKALQKYLEEHPKADRSKHTVEKKTEGGKDKGSPPKVKVDEKLLKKRRPKIESADLSGYPPDASADDLTPEHKEEIEGYELDIVGTSATQAVEIARKIKEGISKFSDICKLNPSTCTKNLGLTRDKMPQIEGEKSVQQMLDSDHPLERKKGQAMVEAGADPKDKRPILQQMLDHLAKNGVKSHNTEVPVGSLFATQSEIKASKVYGMADAHLKGKFNAIDDSVVVSRDGHILDGHHRWAALLAIDPTRKMKVKVVDMDMKDLLEEAQAIPGVYKADFAGEPLDEGAQKKYKEQAKSRFGKPKDAALHARLVRLAYRDLSVRPLILSILV